MSVLLITPPFVQPNTPYPATAFLKGFLNVKKIQSRQFDLSIETLNAVFSSNGLRRVFAAAKNQNATKSETAEHILMFENEYVEKIDIVINALRGNEGTPWHLLASPNFYPQGERFEQAHFTEKMFGTGGLRDKAMHLSSLFIDDLVDFISEAADSDFGLSRYAEKISSSAHYFDDLYQKTTHSSGLVTQIMLELFKAEILETKPDVCAISIPFPGNLLSALLCGKFLKNQFPDIKIIFGGGFVNTELRQISDTRIFEFTDFITLDDGELPLLTILEYIEGKREKQQLKRTFILENEQIILINNPNEPDFQHKKLPSPDYSDLDFRRYFSLIETVNPMQRLWSEGVWNKMTLAHGCYWAKCSFCDTTLDYIKRFEPQNAEQLCDKIEKLIEEKHNRRFHFVDEAAPPALLRDLALELLRRKIRISWWTNVRFERNYTPDLCRLLKESGCIAVSGGLEAAAPRVLNLINKGVTTEIGIRSVGNFSRAGIMVHAYLMYGFPGETEQETIDSLEIVRQMFEAKILLSGYWHRFALTVHSGVAQFPEKFGIHYSDEVFPFSNNEIPFEEKRSLRHEKFSFGLKKAMYNFMYDNGVDFDLSEWFDFKIPKTRIDIRFVKKNLKSNFEYQAQKRVFWLGYTISIQQNILKKNSCEMQIFTRNKTLKIILEKPAALFLQEFLPEISIEKQTNITLEFFVSKLSELQKIEPEKIITSELFRTLRNNGLFVV